MLLMGLDIGTSGCKAAVYDTSGTSYGTARREYGVITGNTAGRFEIDPNEVWNAAKAVMKEAARMAAEVTGKSVAAVGVSSFGESAVPLGQNGEVLANAILYTDKRGEDEARAMEPFVGVTALAPHAMYTLPKLLWLRENRPDIFTKAKKFALFEDFIIYGLTGRFMISHSEAARTACFDVVNRRFHPEIFESLGLDAAVFSEPAKAGTPAGAVLPEIAAELGLSPTTVIAVGGQDQVCAAIGAGAAESGAAVLGIGTVECITPVFGKPITDREMLDCGYCCLPYAIDGKYVTYAYGYTCGSLLQWFRDKLNPDWKTLHPGKSIYKEFDARVKYKETELLLLPHFSGAATPFMDIGATGAVFGLRLTSSLEDIYRAILEGCCYEMLLNIERLEKAGIHIDSVTATGGGSESPVWLQMKADVFGFPVRTPKNAEAGTLGAAIMAGKAAGAFDSLEDGIAAMTEPGGEYKPDFAKRTYYMAKYEKYKKMYAAAKEVTHGA